MGAPEHVATDLSSQPRRGLAPPAPRRWKADRPAELGPSQPTGTGLGNPGPDQGYGYVLAKRFRDRLVLTERESADDAVAGCLGVALRRASLFGRAPIVHDLTLAFTVWGFLGGASPELVAHRRAHFEEAAHHYWAQRAIAEAVPEATLRLPHAEVQARFPADWRALLGL